MFKELRDKDWIADRRKRTTSAAVPHRFRRTGKSFNPGMSYNPSLTYSSASDLAEKNYKDKWITTSYGFGGSTHVKSVLPKPAKKRLSSHSGTRSNFFADVGPVSPTTKARYNPKSFWYSRATL